MIIKALWTTNVNREFVFMFCCPFENQVRLIFNRLNDLIANSPMLKSRVVSSTKSPFEIKFSNKSRIIGFTTSTSSGNGGASIRGQRCDYVAIDECDYMDEASWENVQMLCSERNTICQIVSSTPTGKRGHFYRACTDKRLGYSEHHVPSTMNPLFDENMEAEFRAELSELGYTFEVLAEFGPESSGVFNKECVDWACSYDNYAYNELTPVQLMQLEKTGAELPMMYLPVNNKFKYNAFRTVGVDWDKYGASSSIVVLDYDTSIQKFRVIARIEVPKSDYTYDNAIQILIQVNETYQPSWIYIDRGSGEYQLEALKLYGEKHPSSGLKNKVKGWSFANTIEIPDPITKEPQKKRMKPFMVNQIEIQLERHNLIISPYDDILKRELLNYSVERISASGDPIFSSKDEHYIDALGLAMLAMTLEFKSLAKMIKEIEHSTIIKHLDKGFQAQKAQIDLNIMAQKVRQNNPWGAQPDPNERRGDRPTYFKVPNSTPLGRAKLGSGSWGSRAAARTTSNTRKMW